MWTHSRSRGGRASRERPEGHNVDVPWRVDSLPYVGSRGKRPFSVVRQAFVLSARCPVAKKGANCWLPLCILRLAPDLRDSVLRHLDDLGERILVSHGEVCQDLPIQRYVGLLQPVDETTVRHAVLSSRCVNARDPQPAQVASPLPTVAIGIPLRLHPRFVGPTEEIVPCAPITLCVAQNPLMATTPGSSTLNSHCYITPLKLAVQNKTRSIGGFPDPCSNVNCLT